MSLKLQIYFLYVLHSGLFSLCFTYIFDYSGQTKIRKILPLLLKKVLSIALAFALVGGLLFTYYVDFAAIFREHRDLKGMISPQNTISSDVLLS